MKTSQAESKRHGEVCKGIESALPAIRAFARSLTADRMSADDLVQSSCERALRRTSQVTNLAGIKSWLNRIVYTQWQDVLRKKSRLKENSVSEESEFEAKQKSVEKAYITKLDMETALACLSAEHRSAVVLVSMLGYGYEEAAELLGVPTGTVASRVARGRVILAEYLQKKNE